MRIKSGGIPRPILNKPAPSNPSNRPGRGPIINKPFKPIGVKPGPIINKPFKPAPKPPSPIINRPFKPPAK
jgi:hypothetical protein